MLLVSDSGADEAMFRQALAASNIRLHLSAVRNVDEAVRLLKGDPPFDDRYAHPLPRMVVIDLCDPACDPSELLLWMQSRPELKGILTLVLRDAMDPEDIWRSYSLGANAVVAKPAAKEERIRLYSSLFQFWSLAERPPVVEAGERQT